MDWKEKGWNITFIFVKGNGKEKVRNLRVLPVWEGYGKEILNMFGVGGKWEGNNEIFWRGKGKLKEKLGKVSKSV